MYITINWLWKHMQKVKSSQAANFSKVIWITILIKTSENTESFIYAPILECVILCSM